jgi:4-amino-4-deoxy-L-arabinose transferase-like glycosyltransferase
VDFNQIQIYRLSRASGLQLTLAIIFGLGIVLPLPPLVNSPLHPDEALYAYWAKLISSGIDPMLDSVPIDKPPLFIYLVALCFKWLGSADTVARLPSLLAHLIIIGLTFKVGQTLYDTRIGILAAFLVAVSPFSILFAPTALTDPLMVAFVMLAAWAALNQKPVGAGLGLGLAAATKQQGIFFLPLILGFLVLAQPSRVRHLRSNPLKNPLLQYLLSFSLGLIIPLIWDLNRTQRPGFWLQSSLSYGGLTSAIPQLVGRFLSFVDLLTFVTAQPALNLIFIIGLPLLLLRGWLFPAPQLSQRYADWLLVSFCFFFVLLHTLFTFQVWDRYLLGLVPLLCLVLARVLHLPDVLLKSWPMIPTVLAFTLVIGLMASPIHIAVNAGYPLGGDHGAFAGTDEIAAYLRQHAGANVTLYHHWLGTHWRYYLFGFPYDFRYWRSAEDLAQQAKANAHGIQYIGFPAWQSTTPVQLALSDVGLILAPVFKTIRPDGAPAIFLYKIEAIP